MDQINEKKEKEKTYLVNEIFYSLQGEGVRAGTANIFVRFAGCNLQCALAEGLKSPGGFDCDTEFTSGRRMTALDILAFIKAEFPINASNIIFTGGEPALQVDMELLRFFKQKKYYLAIETNGTIDLSLYQPHMLNWITVSPKIAEHCIKCLVCDEVKYVRNFGQSIPVTVIQAKHKLISPAFKPDGTSDRKTIDWCINLCLQNPEWRISVQQHKSWKVR